MQVFDYIKIGSYKEELGLLFECTTNQKLFLECLSEKREKCMQHAREKYNKEHLLQLPLITPHVCRHMYCSNMARSGMNPKVLQYLMGHSDIGVTLNTYTHLGLEDAKVEMRRIASVS